MSRDSDLDSIPHSHLLSVSCRIKPLAKGSAAHIVWMENGFAYTDCEEYDLMFDQHFHGRNIKIEEGGRIAHKVKK